MRISDVDIRQRCLALGYADSDVVCVTDWNKYGGGADRVPWFVLFVLTDDGWRVLCRRRSRQALLQALEQPRYQRSTRPAGVR